MRLDGDDGINVVQETYDVDGPKYSILSVQTSGEIRLRRLPKGSRYGENGLITVDANVSNPSFEVLQTWTKFRAP